MIVRLPLEALLDTIRALLPSDAEYLRADVDNGAEALDITMASEDWNEVPLGCQAPWFNTVRR